MGEERGPVPGEEVQALHGQGEKGEAEKREYAEGVDTVTSGLDHRVHLLLSTSFKQRTDDSRLK